MSNSFIIQDAVDLESETNVGKKTEVVAADDDSYFFRSFSESSSVGNAAIRERSLESTHKPIDQDKRDEESAMQEEGAASIEQSEDVRDGWTSEDSNMDNIILRSFSSSRSSTKGTRRREWSSVSTNQNNNTNDRASVKFRRISSIVSDGLALIEQQDYAHDEPFVSSLRKSMQIISKSRQALQTQPDTRQPLLKPTTKTLLITIAHLSAYSILGENLRLFMGRLFGSECSNHETWLYSVASSLNSCVTSSIGALFTDLPANMLGCFVMGLFQPSQDLELLNAMPIAFLNTQHWFQTWGLHHLAMRTGFCGALTTFASWNTQMVRLMDGWTLRDGSQFFTALFGYIVGLQVAVASLKMGQTVATWMHRYTNPTLAKEEDMMAFAYSKSKNTNNHDHINKTPLPDYERRYLAFLLSREEHEWAKKNLTALEDLERWKVSTDEYRTGHNDELLAVLHEIERKVLIDEEELGPEQCRTAETEGWNVQALQRFAKDAHGASKLDQSIHDNEGSIGSLVAQYVWASFPFITAFVLVLTFALLDWKTENSEFYRKMWLSAIVTPFGTVVRWKLSSLNGELSGSWAWFPLGTFITNIVASMISVLIAGFFDSRQLSKGIAQVLFAISSGFAASMSTVSTYVVEGDFLTKSYPHHAKAYYYLIGTLVVACALGLVIYSPLVRSGAGY